MKKIIVGLILFSMCTTLKALDGQLLRPNISAPSLEGNLLGDVAGRSIVIYLPPSYDTSNLCYPVIYFLAGYSNYANNMASVASLADAQIRSGTIREMIVVVLDSRNCFQGSFYANSPVTGNWEDFVVKDVVGYVDANYRTLKSPESRAISGHSMGGTGCIHIAMRYPEIFGHLYTMSPGLYDPNGVENQGMKLSRICSTGLKHGPL